MSRSVSRRHVRNSFSEGRLVAQYRRSTRWWPVTVTRRRNGLRGSSAEDRRRLTLLVAISWTTLSFVRVRAAARAISLGGGIRSIPVTRVPAPSHLDLAASTWSVSLKELLVGGDRLLIASSSSGVGRSGSAVARSRRDEPQYRLSHIRRGRTSPRSRLGPHGGAADRFCHPRPR